MAINATVEKAYGSGNKTIYDATAVKETIQGVTTQWSDSLRKMKTDLKFSNKGIMSYLQTSLIKDYNESKMAITMADFWYFKSYR